jgi:hypothetical protein
METSPNVIAVFEKKQFWSKSIYIHKVYVLSATDKGVHWKQSSYSITNSDSSDHIDVI